MPTGMLASAGGPLNDFCRNFCLLTARLSNIASRLALKTAINPKNFAKHQLQFA